MEAAILKGRKLPDWYVEEPPLAPGDQFYLRAFWDLSTERQIGMSVGPIPWSKRRDYAELAGLAPDMIEPFSEIIGHMDSAWLDWNAKETERRSKAKESMRGGKQRKPRRG